MVGVEVGVGVRVGVVVVKIFKKDDCMPNAGKKKHLTEKNHKVTNIKEYCEGFAKFHGGKETAISKAKGLEASALKGNPPDTKTANFWSNVAGNLGKL